MVTLNNVGEQLNNCFAQLQTSGRFIKPTIPMIEKVDVRCAGVSKIVQPLLRLEKRNPINYMSKG